MAETPGRGAGESTRKRKRVEVDVPDVGARSLVHEARTSSDYSVSTVSKDVIEVGEVNPESKFIKIFNSSADKVLHWIFSTICTSVYQPNKGDAKGHLYLLYES